MSRHPSEQTQLRGQVPLGQPVSSWSKASDGIVAAAEASTKATLSHVRRYLELSIVHLAEPDRKALTWFATSSKDEMDWPLTLMSPRGWMMWCPDHPENHAALTENLRQICLCARALECDCVLFDQFAPADKTLPEFLMESPDLIEFIGLVEAWVGE